MSSYTDRSGFYSLGDYRLKTASEQSTSSIALHLTNCNPTSSGYDSSNSMPSIYNFTDISPAEDEKLLEVLPRPELRRKVFPPSLEVEKQIDTYLTALAERYHIDRDLVERLRELEDYEIVILCDDSGSMKTRINGTSKTRWEVLQQIVRIVFFIGVVFDENGIDVYFLNRSPVENVTNPTVIDKAFTKRPSGYSNLAGALKYLFTSEKGKSGGDKKLLIFVATDAEPTNENDKADLTALENIMRNERNAETTHVMFLLCNDKPECVQYLSKWDKEMENVDFTADYETERNRIRDLHGKSISFGDYIVKTLLGAIDEDMDKIND